MDIKIKVETISAAIRYLKGQGIVSKQQDIVNRMGYTKSTVSSALKGNKKYLTDNFIREFNKAFSGIFNESWLLTGEGEMLNDNKYLLKDNSAIVNGNGNSVVSGENNKLEVSKCQDDLEIALREIKHLQERLKDKEDMIVLMKGLLKSNNEPSDAG